MSSSLFVSRLATACVVAAASLLAACAGAPKIAISDTAKSSIHSVSIDPAVTVPPDLYYQGPGQAAMMSLGIVGALASSATAETPKARIKAVMQEKQISVADIVATEFAKQGNAGTAMKFEVGSQPADARVTLAVNIYGISQSQGFGSTLYPMMNLSATMKKPDGTIVWQATDFVSPLNSDNKEGHTIEEYLTDPELLRKAYTNGSDLVARMLVSDLAGAKK